MLQEQEQELDGLFLELDRATVLPKLTRTRIDFEIPEADEVGQFGRRQGVPPGSERVPNCGEL